MLEGKDKIQNEEQEKVKSDEELSDEQLEEASGGEIVFVDLDDLPVMDVRGNEREFQRIKTR